MDYVQKYIDIGMFNPDPEDHYDGGVLNNAAVPEGSLIYDAQQAMWDGRAFPQTNVGWENILANIGQAYKDWFRGENGMDGPRCIARMDELQNAWLNNSDVVYFCESTADFTLEEQKTVSPDGNPWE